MKNNVIHLELTLKMYSIYGLSLVLLGLVDDDMTSGELTGVVGNVDSIAVVP